VPPRIKYDEPSIGRVITPVSARRKGYGKLLMTEAIRRLWQIYPNRAIRISAQLYLERFYNAFGFVRCSAPYDEDGIPHIQMLLMP
jgi:ElaA protein